MKTYTDVEQSKKLAKILPLESADTWYAEVYEAKPVGYHDYIVCSSPYYSLSLVKPSENNISQNIVNNNPCWSLAALMEILDGASFTRCGTAPEFHEATIFYTDEAPTLKRMTCTGTSYVDACYNMIMKLHEMNILSLSKTKEEQL